MKRIMARRARSSSNGAGPRAVLRVLTAAAFSSVCALAGAQNFPNHPMRLIVPILPGGTMDGASRAIAREMEASLKQPVIVENRAGGGGAVGAQAVAKAAPDGYTMLISHTALLVTLPAMQKDLPYKPEELAPVSILWDYGALVLVTGQPKPYQSLQDLIAAAKARPGQLSAANTGPGTPTHLLVEVFKTEAGIDLVSTSYKGEAPALIDLMGGQVDAFAATMAGTLGNAKAGRLRPLVVFSEARVPALPDVPSAKELGYPKASSMLVWSGISVPAGTPPALVAVLNKAAVSAVQTQSVRDQLGKLSLNSLGTTPEAMAQRLRDEEATLVPLVKRLNLRAD